MTYQPLFTITPKIINQISAISLQIGRLDSQTLNTSPQLRKQNRIRTIQSTFAIEGNTLSLDQVTAIINGQRVLGHPREIAEVEGANQAYAALPNLNPTKVKDLLAAHRHLTAGILTDAGKFRKGGVGIQKGVVHFSKGQRKKQDLLFPPSSF